MRVDRNRARTMARILPTCWQVAAVLRKPGAAQLANLSKPNLDL